MEVLQARQAVIDVGTNSVKVLVADVHGGIVTPVFETSEQTRLGRGFYETHRLLPEPIAMTAAAVARYALQARTMGASRLRVVATSAARDAINQEDLLGAIRAASGLEVEVISGELEAQWGFAGVTSSPAMAHRRLLVVDVGGGSTEFILGEGTAMHFRESFALGSVRLLERLQPSGHPSAAELAGTRRWIREWLLREVEPRLGPCLARHGIPEMAVGVGGTTAILALVYLRRTDFDRELIESTRFDRAALGELMERLWSVSIEDRRRLPGLPPERADVILTGVAIYEAIVDVFRLPCLVVSTRGLRFGALLET